jgi:hypothetical protein
MISFKVSSSLSQQLSELNNHFVKTFSALSSYSDGLKLSPQLRHILRLTEMSSVKDQNIIMF